MPLSKSDLVRTALFSKFANLVESCYYPLLYHKYDGVSKRENLRYADCGKRAVLDVYRQEKGSPEKLPLFFIYTEAVGSRENGPSESIIACAGRRKVSSPSTRATTILPARHIRNI